MTNAPKQPAPRGLGSAGKALWARMTNGITYRPDEVTVLEQACRLADTIADLEKALKGQPLQVTGARGQQVANPLLVELRHTRSEMTRLLARLDVPEANGQSSRSAKARASARARWHGPQVVG